MKKILIIKLFEFAIAMLNHDLLNTSIKMTNDKMQIYSIFNKN